MSALKDESESGQAGRAVPCLIDRALRLLKLKTSGHENHYLCLTPAQLSLLIPAMPVSPADSPACERKS